METSGPVSQDSQVETAVLSQDGGGVALGYSSRVYVGYEMAAPKSRRFFSGPED